MNKHITKGKRDSGDTEFVTVILSVGIALTLIGTYLGVELLLSTG